MTRAVKILKYEAIINLCLELLEEKEITNGGRTTCQEMIALARGRLKILQE